jgi:guanylate kinase
MPELSKDVSQKLQSYHLGEQGQAVVRKARMIMLAGIIAAGKDALGKKLAESGAYHIIVSHTTRQPRKNNGILEQNGREYHFVAPEKILELMDKQEMVEVNDFGGNIYGTSVAEFRYAVDEHKIAMSDIDINGILHLREIAGDSLTSIFVVPPDFTTWISRFRGRYESDEAFAADYEHRKQISIAELERALKIPSFHFIINDDLDRSVEVIAKLAAREKDEVTSGDEPARLVVAKLLEDIKAS